MLLRPLRRPRPLPVMEVEEADDGILALGPSVGDVTLILPSGAGSVLSNLSSYGEDRLSLESLLLRLDTLLAMDERLANEMVATSG